MRTLVILLLSEYYIMGLEKHQDGQISVKMHKSSVKMATCSVKTYLWNVKMDISSVKMDILYVYCALHYIVIVVCWTTALQRIVLSNSALCCTALDRIKWPYSRTTTTTTMLTWSSLNSSPRNALIHAFSVPHPSTKLVVPMNDNGTMAPSILKYCRILQWDDDSIHCVLFCNVCSGVLYCVLCVVCRAATPISIAPNWTFRWMRTVLSITMSWWFYSLLLCRFAHVLYVLCVVVCCIAYCVSRCNTNINCPKLDVPMNENGFEYYHELMILLIVIVSFRTCIVCIVCCGATQISIAS